jgi:hypothetical protein
MWPRCRLKSVKPPNKTALLKIRIDPQQKKKLEREAARAGLGLSAWIRAMLTAALREMSSKHGRKRNADRQLAAVAKVKDGDSDLRRQIRTLLALPMEERTHFLRVVLPGGGSCL